MSAKSNAGRTQVYGASGSGKSSYVKKRIAKERRLVVFDTQQEYPNCQRASTVDQVRKIMAANWSKGFRIAYVPPVNKEARALSQLCKLLLVAQQPFKDGKSKTGLTLVVEEMNLSYPLGKAGACPGFGEMCSRGRHYGIQVYGLSQRISEVDTRWRGNCTETVIFRANGSTDIRTAAATTGAGVEQIKALTNLEYLQEQNGTVTKGRVRHG